MKIFLPFTINLDPYLKKLVKEEVQNLEAAAVNAKPTSAASSTLPERAAMQQKSQAYRSTADRYWPAPSADPAQPAEKSWPAQDPRQQWTHLTRHIPVAFVAGKLSDLSVGDVCALLAAVLPHHGPGNENGGGGAIQVVKANNISGRVLAACDLTELRAVLGLNFGDWNLFRLALLSMRELEVRGFAAADTLPAVAMLDVEAATVTPATEGDSETTRALAPPRTLRQDSVEKQVQLENEAVSGLLVRINETAREAAAATQQLEAAGKAAETKDDDGTAAAAIGGFGDDEKNLDHLFQFEADSSRVALGRTAEIGGGEPEVSQLVYSTRSLHNLEESDTTALDRPSVLQPEARRTPSRSGSVVFSDLDLDERGDVVAVGRYSSIRTSTVAAVEPLVVRGVNFAEIRGFSGRRESGPTMLMVRNERQVSAGAEEEGAGGPYAWLDNMVGLPPPHATSLASKKR